MVKVAAYLIAFYLVYSIMLSRDTTYGRNRVFILVSIITALIFPLITFQTLRPMNIQFFGKFLSDVYISATSDGGEQFNTGLSFAGPLKVIYSLYFLGVAVFLFKLSVDLANLLFLILRQKVKGTRIIRFNGFSTSGFSAMGYIFVNAKLNPEDAENIISHEQNHLRQNHFIDIIIVEIVKAFQWFNPVVYLFNRSLRAIHEYQADQDCLSSGIPVVNYQSLLLNQVFKSRAFNLTNSFSNPSLIKKRMIMMTKKRTTNLASLKLLSAIPAVCLVFFAISACKENVYLSDNQPKTPNTTQISSGTISESALPAPPPPPPQNLNTSEKPKKVIEEAEPEPFVVVEEMPQFPGGETALLRYISDNTIYPVEAKDKNIEGRVIISFCVTAKGAINQISVLKGVDPVLDQEAIRVVQTLPAFKPGKQGGKAVPVWYRVPITFTLK